MATQAEVLSASLFKPRRGGWVYRAPNPWIVGRPPHYLVNDTQRAQIIEALTAKRPITIVLSLAALLSGWIAFFATAVWFGYRFQEPSPQLMMLVFIVAPAFAAIAVSAAAMRKRISDVLAAAPLTFPLSLRLCRSE